MQRWEVFVLVEFVALLMGLLMPVTPSKTGSSGWSPAQLVFAEPSYLQEAAVYFVLANLLMALLGALFLGLARTSDRREEP